MLGISKNNNKLINLENIYNRFNNSLDYFSENAQ